MPRTLHEGHICDIDLADVGILRKHVLFKSDFVALLYREALVLCSHSHVLDIEIIVVSVGKFAKGHLATIEPDFNFVRRFFHHLSRGERMTGKWIEFVHARKGNITSYQVTVFFKMMKLIHKRMINQLRLGEIKGDMLGRLQCVPQFLVTQEIENVAEPLILMW